MSRPHKYTSQLHLLTYHATCRAKHVWITSGDKQWQQEIHSKRWPKHFANAGKEEVYTFHWRINQCSRFPLALSDFFPHFILQVKSRIPCAWSTVYCSSVYPMRGTKYDTILLKCMKWRCNEEGSWTGLSNTRQQHMVVPGTQQYLVLQVETVPTFLRFKWSLLLFVPFPLHAISSLGDIFFIIIILNHLKTERLKLDLSSIQTLLLDTTDAIFGGTEETAEPVTK